jgi:flagellar biosynthetic protein FliQ
MTVDLVKELSGEVFKTILLVSAPTLLVSLIVGLLVSLLQAVTQIQEFTLTFVPKIIAVFVALFVCFPWIASIVISFTVNLIGRIPEYVR